MWIAVTPLYSSNELVSLLMCVCVRGNACQWISPLPSPAVWEWVWHQIRRPLCSDAELSTARAPAPICASLLTFHKRLISHAVWETLTYRTRTHTPRLKERTGLTRTHWPGAAWGNIIVFLTHILRISSRANQTAAHVSQQMIRLVFLISCRFWLFC